MNVVPMGKIQRLPAAQAAAQHLVVNLALDFVGDQQGQDVGALGDFRHATGPRSHPFLPGPRISSRRLPDHDFEA